MELPKSLIFRKCNPYIYLGLFLINLYKIVDIILLFDIIQPLTNKRGN